MSEPDSRHSLTHTHKGSDGKNGQRKQTTGTDKKKQKEKVKVGDDDDNREEKKNETHRRTFLRHRLQSRQRKTFGPENLSRAHRTGKVERTKKN